MDSWDARNIHTFGVIIPTCSPGGPKDRERFMKQENMSALEVSKRALSLVTSSEFIFFRPIYGGFATRTEYLGPKNSA
jgi:hypothetical protein